MDDKTQFAIDSGNPIWPFILGGTIFGIMFGIVIGLILGVTTGHLSTGIWGGVSMAIAGAIGFNIMIIRKLK